MKCMSKKKILSCDVVKENATTLSKGNRRDWKTQFGKCPYTGPAYFHSCFQEVFFWHWKKRCLDSFTPLGQISFFAHIKKKRGPLFAYQRWEEELGWILGFTPSLAPGQAGWYWDKVCKPSEQVRAVRTPSVSLNPSLSALTCSHPVDQRTKGLAVKCSLSSWHVSLGSLGRRSVQEGKEDRSRKSIFSSDSQ